MPITVPVVVMILGGALYFVPHPKWSELGRWSFVLGMFWWLAAVSHTRILG